MKRLIVITSFACLFICTSFTVHKYYLSVTDIEYNKEEKSLQMITRLFYDDLEDVLRERYDETIIVDATSDQEVLDNFIKKYLKRKLKITINGEERTLSYIGKEYEDDYVVCYIEIADVSSIQRVEIENTLLMDAFTEQKNMVHTNILGKKKSLLLVDGNAKAVLNFSE
ncbi:hypothetical protein GCM10011344_31410 [Dokdonia pacifica]|uniref:Peptidase E n=1 Tax=Dokdonia pacifica TaxID=1627892 RepID=A0A239BNV3_9FLAO|nr:DUF6702 family protein [Dokdonia pacifica]GGG28341.1 hypothetical protein GCM10011344_31410 [Dokdonia pacifica]SNS09566.1 hypothetical protein SAMN06265376_106329 [Dokdonia pacifica]